MSSSLLSASDFQTREDLDKFLAGAVAMIPFAKAKRYKPPLVHHGKVMLNFKEDSSRTAGSFDEASIYLGLRTSLQQGSKGSSLSKGESPLDDLLTRVTQGTAEYITRTKVEGEARYLAECLQRLGHQISVINGGDGEHDHVTQALLDFLTILLKLGRIDNFTIGFGGDLRLSRVVHAIVTLLRLCYNVRVVLAPFGGLDLPTRYRKGLNIVDEARDDFGPLRQCHVIILTRIQRERGNKVILDDITYERLRHIYVMRRKFLDTCRKDVLVMHPQPIVFEIHPEIRFDPRVIVDEQGWNGIPTRMHAIKRGLTEYHPIDLDVPEEDLVIEHRIVKRIKKKVKYFAPIEHGTNIDHLPNGGRHFVEFLLDRFQVPINGPVLPGWRLDTKKVSGSDKKDMVLMHDSFLPDHLAGTISLMYPDATFNVFPGDGMMHKKRYRPPRNIINAFNCPSPDCITNNDRYAQSWLVMEADGMISCHYCEREFALSELQHV